MIGSRRHFVRFARGPGHRLYAASAPLIRALCTTAVGRALLERGMRGGGRALLWAFDAEPGATPEEARAEWERVLGGIGLEPRHTEGACATCFARCTLDLGPGDDATCETVMSINHEMLRRLGGEMVMVDRLTRRGATECRVEVREPRVLPGERDLWCDDETARSHFDRAAPFYDWIMGYFEIPSNQRAVRRLSAEVPARGARVLELGAGTGLGLLALLRALPPDARVTAVDTSRAMLARTDARLRRHGVRERVELVHADASALPARAESFDAVYSSFLLDLLDVPARRAILAEARRVLRPAAPARFVVMDAEPPRAHDRMLTAAYNAGYARWNPIWKALFAGYAPHCRPVRLAPLLEQAGFRIAERDRAYVTVFPVAVWSCHA